MGGTGKVSKLATHLCRSLIFVQPRPQTVTAVAAVQELEVRVWFRDIYLLTVCEDAVGERIKQLAAVLY